MHWRQLRHLEGTERGHEVLIDDLGIALVCFGRDTGAGFVEPLPGPLADG